MRTLILAGLVCTLTLGATEIDQTYEQVVAENGAPTGKMQAGDTIILRYPTQTVRLKAGKVVSVEAARASGPASATPSRATPAVTAAPKPPSPAPAAPMAKLSWTTDYRAALETAQAQNRRVFLFFTGSDWCGWCMRLNREILSTPEFAAYAAENLVLVEVDFPNQKTQSVGLKKQNTTLARAFEVQGFPTVVILNAQGRAIGRLGYEEGGPKPWVKKLGAL